MGFQPRVQNSFAFALYVAVCTGPDLCRFCTASPMRYHGYPTQTRPCYIPTMPPLQTATSTCPLAHALGCHLRHLQQSFVSTRASLFAVKRVENIMAVALFEC